MSPFSPDYVPQIVTDAPKKRRKPTTEPHPAAKHFTVAKRRSELDYAHTAKLSRAAI